jgi:hypothetical protein
VGGGEHSRSSSCQRVINWIGKYVPVDYYQIRFDGMAAVMWDVSRVVLVVILGIAGRELL